MLKELATNILRTVPAKNAFFFYRAVESPTGAAARNLHDFLGIINSIDSASLEFHLGRDDFENWIKMLGDDALASQLKGIKEKNVRGEALRLRLNGTIRSRLDRLQKSAQ